MTRGQKQPWKTEKNKDTFRGSSKCEIRNLKHILEDLKDRTKRFSLDVMKFVEQIPVTTASKVVINQLIRSGTSVGANTRSAYRGRSKKEFLAKLGIVIEEADESEYWIELLEESGIIKNDLTNKLKKEASELVSIFTSVRKKHG